MKASLYLLFVLLLLFFYLKIRIRSNHEVLPVFMQNDTISLQNSKSDIHISIHSEIKPSSYSLDKLKSDYKKIWAHLNHLYQTNDIEKGKEYYTEEWYKFIVRRPEKINLKAVIARKDHSHNLIIKNWSKDSLICLAIDSNILLSYHINGSYQSSERANIAVVLLYQGDNWRLDALKVLSTKKIDKPL